ncbi:hypothetical protein OBBRIDRAFT_802963 [Obba rivulosa]|uniref:Uncharacterized protein n=1 Tax=Obba rivulosa TaxID=1052685 RepID=A0A8E2DNX5_9APHY|nr:hypothetical protein OBBRIDRAFT_802963 [Obba rivulosa]
MSGARIITQQKFHSDTLASNKPLRANINFGADVYPRIPIRHARSRAPPPVEAGYKRVLLIEQGPKEWAGGMNTSCAGGRRAITRRLPVTVRVMEVARRRYWICDTVRGMAYNSGDGLALARFIGMKFHGNSCFANPPVGDLAHFLSKGIASSPISPTIRVLTWRHDHRRRTTLVYEYAHFDDYTSRNAGRRSRAAPVSGLRRTSAGVVKDGGVLLRGDREGLRGKQELTDTLALDL